GTLLARSLPKNDKLAMHKRSTALMLRIATLFPILKKPSSWLFLHGFHLNESYQLPLRTEDASKKSKLN
ncbi:MAG: hypothetical protein V3S80_07195, partial [Sulfurimonadaceae bacterium]